jgi:hypothetical protein
MKNGRRGRRDLKETEREKGPINGSLGPRNYQKTETRTRTGGDAKMRETNSKAKERIEIKLIRGGEKGSVSGRSQRRKIGEGKRQEKD